MRSELCCGERERKGSGGYLLEVGGTKRRKISIGFNEFRILSHLNVSMSKNEEGRRGVPCHKESSIYSKTREFSTFSKTASSKPMRE